MHDIYIFRCGGRHHRDLHGRFLSNREFFWRLFEEFDFSVSIMQSSSFGVKLEKSHFMVKEGIVLGHIISGRGIEVDKVKIDVMRSLQSPRSVREIRAFLGHVGFYRRFIKDFSKISRPLCRLLQKEIEFDFDEKCVATFSTLKELLTNVA